LQRQIEAEGAVCEGIAPSLTPVKLGERIKTDRRDAKKLVGSYRSGELTVVHAPDEEAESVRNLVRCREAAQSDLQRSRQRLGKFLLRRAWKQPPRPPVGGAGRRGEEGWVWQETERVRRYVTDSRRT